MTKRFAGIALAAVAIAAHGQQQETIVGKWNVHTNVGGQYEGDAVCTITQTGDKVAADCGAMGSTTTGIFKDNKLELHLTGGQASLKFTGVVSKEKMSGAILVEEYGMDGIFTGVLAK